MNIVIAGAGKVGSALCRDLTAEGHSLTVIELDEDGLEEILNSYDVNGVAGNGAAYETQLEAGADGCDVFIAVMESDETNLIAAITAGKLGARHTIARVRNPEYSAHSEFWHRGFGITLLINPEHDAADAMNRMLLYPSASSIESSSNGRVELAEIQIDEQAPMIGLRVMDYHGRFGKVLLCLVVRQDTVIIPNGSTVLQPGDLVAVTGEIAEVLKFCGLAHKAPARIGSVLIIGGGRITSYLTASLLKRRIRAKIIEIRQEVADKLSLDFPQAEVSLGDGTEHHFLTRVRAQDYDAIASLTGIDEENILLSLYASKLGIKKTITKVNRTDLLKILSHVGLESVITPYQLSINRIMRFIRSTEGSAGSHIEAFYRLAGGQAEVLQFKVLASSKAVNVKLKDMRIKKGIIIMASIRGNQLSFPAGESYFMPGDEVLLATTHKGFEDLDDILERRVWL